MKAGGLDIQVQPVRPASLAERVYQTYHPIAGRQGVEMHQDASVNYSSIYVDEGRMLQVLSNLVDNPLRYTPREQDHIPMNN